MNDSGELIRLTKKEVDEIKRQARAKLGECKKTQAIIEKHIFPILSLYVRVFYYPIGKEGPWGITYMSGRENSGFSEKPFVAINTSIPVDAQVFAAAHELYHIWYDQKAEILPSSILDSFNGQNKQSDISELKANRFAAEFLVDEDLLYSEMKLHYITPGRIKVKDIITLASMFIVPYKTMVKRLFEVDAISFEECRDYLRMNESTIDQLRKRYSIPIYGSDDRIALDNLVDLAVSSYEKKLITYEKLEYLLFMSDLKPEDVGISKPEGFIPLCIN
jgi:Zn-dependent peptidase ImmA (M78 family)